MSNNVKRLIESMIQVDPKARPKIDAVFQNNNWLTENSETFDKLHKLYRHFESETLNFSDTSSDSNNVSR